MTLLIYPAVALKSFSIFITFFLLADRIASVFGGAHLVPAASKSPLNLLLMVKIVTHDVNFSNHCTCLKGWCDQVQDLYEFVSILHGVYNFYFIAK